MLNILIYNRRCALLRLRRYRLLKLPEILVMLPMEISIEKSLIFDFDPYMRSETPTVLPRFFGHACIPEISGHVLIFELNRHALIIKYEIVSFWEGASTTETRVVYIVFRGF